MSCWRLFWFWRNWLFFHLFCLFDLCYFYFFIIITFLFGNYIFLSTFFGAFHSRPNAIFSFWFCFFYQRLVSSHTNRNNSFFWRRNNFLWPISINCLRFSCCFSNLAIRKYDWSFPGAIRDYTTRRRYVSYMRVIILRMIWIRVINILRLLSIFKWNIGTLFCNLNRLHLRCRNINIINLICYILR